MDKVLIVVGFVAIMAVIALLSALPVLLLWNWLVPDLFGLRSIDFWQALGLLILAQLLFTRNLSTSKKGDRS